MENPLINIGWKMKRWLNTIIKRDFGKVSYAKGLYNILYLYNRYVPKEAKLKMRGTGVRVPYKKKWI